MEKVSRLFNGVPDVDPDGINLNTLTKLRHGKTQFLTAVGGNPISLQSAASGSRTQTFPDESGTILTNVTANIVKNDLNNAFGAFYQDLAQRTAPPNPSAGTRRIYVDSVTGKISVRTSAGITISLEEKDTIFDPDATQTFNNKTIPFGTNILTDVMSTNTTQEVSGHKTWTGNHLVAHNKLRLQVAAGTNFISFNLPALTASLGVTFPNLAAGDTFLFESHPASLAAKTLITPKISAFSAATEPTTTDIPAGHYAVARNTNLSETKLLYNDAGTIKGVVKGGANPENGRVGGWIGGTPISGYGISAGALTTTGTFVDVNNATDGKCKRLTTSTAIGGQAGWRGNLDDTAVQRGRVGRLRCRFRLNQITGVRVYIGLHGSAVAWRTGDNPLEIGGGASSQGVIMLVRSTDTQFQYARNNTVDPGSIASSNVNMDTNIHTFEIRGSPAGSTSWNFLLDGANMFSTNTDVPTGIMYPIVQIENVDGGTAKTMDVWWWTLGADA